MHKCKFQYYFHPHAAAASLKIQLNFRAAVWHSSAACVRANAAQRARCALASAFCPAADGCDAADGAVRAGGHGAQPAEGATADGDDPCGELPAQYLAVDCFL